MLVLSRKLNESICIGQDIEITVSEIRGNRVRLAISAPREVPVVRREVAEQSCLFALASPPILGPLARRVREPAGC